jgi:hypothetical protein
MEGGGN